MRKYSVHVGCLYLELVGSYQEEIDTYLHRACERYASAGSRQRRIVTFSSDPSGTVCVLTTNKDDERRHTRPVRTRLNQLAAEGTIVCHNDYIDEDKATANRVRTVANAFDATALWALRFAAKSNLVRPDDSFWGFDLAPGTLEEGTRYPNDPKIKEPGLDIVMTLNPKNNNLPRYPVFGINVKASKGSDRSTALWYSPRIDALALNLHVGRWPASDDDEDILHHRFKTAVQTDGGTRQLLAFVERNIEPFGDYLLRRVANGIYLAKWKMEGKNYGKRDRGILMLPTEGECRDRLYEQVNQLSSLFETSGIHPTWRYHRSPENDALHRFLPTTPLQ